MTVGSTRGVDAFLAARAAASRRLESTAAAGARQALTGNAAASENVAAAQPSKAPAKGQYIDVLA